MLVNLSPCIVLLFTPIRMRLPYQTIEPIFEVSSGTPSKEDETLKSVCQRVTAVGEEEEPRAVVPFGARIARASDAIAASSSEARSPFGDRRLEPRLRKASSSDSGSVTLATRRGRAWTSSHSAEVPAPAAAPAGYKDISRSHGGVYVEEMSNSYVLGGRRRRRNRFRLLDVPNNQGPLGGQLAPQPQMPGQNSQGYGLIGSLDQAALNSQGQGANVAQGRTGAQGAAGQSGAHGQPGKPGQPGNVGPVAPPGALGQPGPTGGLGDPQGPENRNLGEKTPIQPAAGPERRGHGENMPVHPAAGDQLGRRDANEAGSAGKDQSAYTGLPGLPGEPGLPAVPQNPSVESRNFPEGRGGTPGEPGHAGKDGE
ncbi:hypothetical protein HPB51_025169 [Rhipicephalus microplus]|uniref:Uncharacterized protein n=1 Tax=Rhipicephalus microplus TaxID=6941 RepID=A0A9J6E5F0_RHIMP|nr:hypothetical protein HPB51_025169 [Rhipicephalus microplus]